MRYKPDHVGVGRLLLGEDMADAMRTVAQAGRALAISTSPVGDNDDDEHRRYIESFEVEVEVDGDRQTAILLNTADHAFAVELRHHVLGRVSDWMEAGA